MLPPRKKMRRARAVNLKKHLKQSLQGIGRIGQTANIARDIGIRWLRGDRPPIPKLLRQTFERLGTTYIKLGQFIASSPSLFPSAYVKEFQHCLDNTPSLPFSVIEGVLRSELQRPLYDVYSEIDPKPLASASIAQVHAARLVTGEEVVIKVQKPGVRTVLLTDLNFLYISAKLLEKFVPQLRMASLSDIVQELQLSMLSECDFYQEAQNIADFHHFLEKTHNTLVTAPKVYPEASTLRVLTMERFYGVSFVDLERVKRYSADPQFSLITAMNTWFSSLLMSQSFHADVHAGNLMVLKDGRIGFIDFGIVGRIKPDTWSSVAHFISAITDSDYLGMAESMVGIGVTDKEVNIDALAQDIQNLYETMDQMHGHTPHFGDKKIGINDGDVNQLMMDLVGIGKQYGIHFPREFALLLKQILYFDRYVQLLAPDAHIYSDQRLIMLPELVMERA